MLFRQQCWTNQLAQSQRDHIDRQESDAVDGKQGPYSLTAKNGNKDIVIIAGSERVWLNGLRLFRGEDYDYTIDYSLGEISFMPKNLIFFDTDLYIEYEYADEQYTRNLFTSSVNKKINNKGNLQLSWIREFDQNLYSNNEIDSELLSIFKNFTPQDTSVTRP